MRQPATVHTEPLRALAFHRSPDHRDLHPFPTRRSSDLASAAPSGAPSAAPPVSSAGAGPVVARVIAAANQIAGTPDRKSTRLNFSHQIISYAVFCLKKKNTTSSPTSTSS